MGNVTQSNDQYGQNNDITTKTGLFPTNFYGTNLLSDSGGQSQQKKSDQQANEYNPFLMTNFSSFFPTETAFTTSSMNNALYPQMAPTPPSAQPASAPIAPQMAPPPPQMPPQPAPPPPQMPPQMAPIAPQPAPPPPQMPPQMAPIAPQPAPGAPQWTYQPDGQYRYQTLNDQGQMTHSLTQKYDPVSGQWVDNRQQWFNSSPGSGKPASMMSMQYDPVSGQWGMPGGEGGAFMPGIGIGY